MVYQGKVGIWSLVPLFFLGLCFWIFIDLAFYFGWLAAIRYLATELVIKNKRVIAKFGPITRSTIEINIHKIEGVQVKQEIFGRIFSFGAIIVYVAGNPQVLIAGASNSLQFRSEFVDTQESNA